MKNDINDGNLLVAHTYEKELDRIAIALERIAAALEKESTDENVENMRMNISVDAEELAEKLLEKNSINAGEIKVTSLETHVRYLEQRVAVLETIFEALNI